jgi:cardiolipin synthase
MPPVPDLFEHPDGTSTGEIEIDRILTAPNVITTVRALCIPLFLYLLFWRDSHGWAGFVLGALGATDWVDGYVARRFNQTSTFGKMYDPTVDRLMMVVGIISIIVDGSVPLWFALVILIREVLVAGWVLTTVALGAKRMNVTWWGKVGTFANMCAFPWFLFSHEATFSDGVQTLWKVLAYCAVVPGVTFSLLAAGQYVTLGRRAIAEGRAERAAAERAGDPR